MAKHTRMNTLAAVLDVGLVPVFHHPDVETARNIVSACADGGARVIEFTNRGDLAWRVFADLIEYANARYPDLILGTGSVLDASTAGLYINCGANFIVGPCLNPEAARVCNRRKIPYMPGCGSVTEISQAEELGVEIVKIFPGGQVGGPGFVKAVLGPLPWSRLMPTGGGRAHRGIHRQLDQGRGGSPGYGVEAGQKGSGPSAELDRTGRKCLQGHRSGPPSAPGMIFYQTREHA